MATCTKHGTPLIPTPGCEFYRYHCEKCVQEKHGFDPEEIDAAIAGKIIPMTQSQADIAALVAELREDAARHRKGIFRSGLDERLDRAADALEAKAAPEVTAREEDTQELIRLRDAVYQSIDVRGEGVPEGLNDYEAEFFEAALDYFAALQPEGKGR